MTDLYAFLVLAVKCRIYVSVHMCAKEPGCKHLTFSLRNNIISTKFYINQQKISNSGFIDFAN